MSFDLSAFSKPLSHAEAVKTGLMIDCTSSAAWSRINMPTFLSQEVVIECIGKGRDAGDRMRILLDGARRVLASVKPNGGAQPARLRFQMLLSAKRSIPLILTARLIDGRPVIYITLEN
jgi:hypothetical protein